MPPDCRREIAEALGITHEELDLDGVETHCEYYLGEKSVAIRPGETKRLLGRLAASGPDFDENFRSLPFSQVVAVENACALYGLPRKSGMSSAEFVRYSAAGAAKRIPKNPPREPFGSFINLLLLDYEDLTGLKATRSVQRKPSDNPSGEQHITAGAFKKFLMPCLRAVGVEGYPDRIVRDLLAARKKSIPAV